jgi:diketogulonate reductase-like aldo/keto reductase
MLLHWPATFRSQDPGNAARRIAAWKVLESFYKRGWTRAIGVSNFGVAHIQQLMQDGAEIPPMVNQIEASVFLQFGDIVEYCHAHGIVLQAYSPLGRGLVDITKDAVVVAIAKKHNRNEGQIAMRYLVQLGYAVTFLSSSAERLVSNQDIFAFELDEQDMKELSALNRPDGSWGLPSPDEMA